jgi:tetratricopeptide (TPR) repeat protein
MPLRKLATLVLLGLLCSLWGCQPSKADPKKAYQFYAKGQLLAYQGNLDAALAELAKALKADPDLSVAHTAMGDIHRRQGSYDLAVRDYEGACQANPYAFRPHYNLGVTYQLLARAGKSLDEVRDYLQKAADIYIRAVALRPDDYEANLNLGVCYYQLDKQELAEQQFLRSVQINSGSAFAYGNLGILYQRQGKLYDAIHAYKTSLELDGAQVGILVNLGTAYVNQGRLDSAMQTFERATQVDPNDGRPWEQIGSLHYRNRELPEALEAYGRAVDLNGRSATAQRGMGVVCLSQFLLDQSRTDLRDKGLAAWNRSLELKPDQPDLVKLVAKYTPTTTGPQL